MNAALRTLIRCLVCGFAEVRTDEVVDRGLVLLHECPRCSHRWTDPAGGRLRRDLVRTTTPEAARSAA